MIRSRLLTVSVALFIGAGLAWGQSAPKSSGKTTTKKTFTKSTAKKKSKKKKISSARVRRMHRAFVASSKLKPMARQLLETRSAAAYNGVEAYARKNAGTDSGVLANLVLGYAHVLDADYLSALPPLRKAQAREGDLGDYIDYYLGLAYSTTGDRTRAIEILKGYAIKYPDSLLLRDAVKLYGNALVLEGRASDAISVLEANRTPLRADIEFALGRAYVEAGQAAKGGAVLRNIVYTIPASPEAPDAAGLLAPLAASGVVQPGSFNERSTRAALLASANKWSDAAKEYRDLLGEAPASERGRIQVLLGVALRRSGSAKEAKEVLQGASVTGDLNAQRLAMLAEISRIDENDEEYFRLLNELRQSSPASSFLEGALLNAGNIFLLRREYDKAIDYYREVYQRFPKGTRASYAHWKASWLTYRQGRREDAKKEFRLHVDQYPSSAETPAAVYWRARLAEEDKDYAIARAWYDKVVERYRNYYYGVLATERLQFVPAVPMPDDPVLAKIPSLIRTEKEQLEEAPEDELRVEKSKLLENAGMFDSAMKELQAIPGKQHWATAEVARMYSEADQYHRALQILKRSVPQYFSLDYDDLPRQYWESLFPRPFWKDLKKFAEANELDPYLVASLIRQESEFNPGAVSRANALGLMQLLPSVGKSTARQLRVRGYSTNSLFVPSTNMQLGTKYFRMMVDKFGGQVEYALAAYNAGSNRVDDWMANGRYADIPEFVESIPFTETREYVQAIMRNAKVYKQLYPDERERASK